MPISLQVSEVRAAIYRAAGGPQSAGNGSPSTAQLGRLFHEIFAELTSPAGREALRALFDEADPGLEEWRAALISHTYQRLTGPRLRQHQHELHATAEYVLTFWDAVQELCGWFAEILWQAQTRGVFKEALASLALAEEDLRWELSDPAWTDSVVLTGRADAVWHVPETDRWCVIELKTGRTAPEADLAQVCLYHQMLIAAGLHDHGKLALVSFDPYRREQLFEATHLGETQHRLWQLIGQLAGVLPSKKTDTKPGATAVPPPVPNPANPEYLELGKKIERAFAEYSTEINLGQPIVGPTFLRFPLVLGRRVTLPALWRNTTNVQSRLGLAAPPRLSLEGGRIALDLQRPDRQTVYFSQIRSQLPACDELLGNARAPIGVDLNGELRLADFQQPENAHLLVAGTTGSGKSEWLRAAVAGLLLTNTPATLRLALADPKRSAFQFLRDSPFLLGGEIAYEEEQVFEMLKGLVVEMEARYQTMSEQGVDTLTELVKKTGQARPRIFFICDEYAYLMTGDTRTRKRLEDLIKKLGFKARAAGIHMILATQQPSRQVVTGTIKANLNAKVGLLTSSDIESNMLLDSPEAKTLLGNGDLLFKCIGDPIRLQAPLVSKEDLAGLAR
jgi:S-DNA-T family DNA segregation ATPase FtsK/SpoIIIE